MRFPLVHADAERAPFADASFDLAISEYGAAIWCDPYRWIPEAARMLRPGGRLFFLGGTLLMLCYPKDDDEAPAGTTLARDSSGCIGPSGTTRTETSMASSSIWGPAR